jgi:hypothetical protein
MRVLVAFGSFGLSAVCAGGGSQLFQIGIQIREKFQIEIFTVRGARKFSVR